MRLAAGSKLGAYEILGTLGAGGMGEVYRARDTRLGREVALKILPAAMADDELARARFEQEARALAALSHPNVMAIHDFDVEDGIAYAVTELLEGRSLRERLSSGTPPLREALELAAQVARGLGAAHDKGIVHRDVKPENVLLLADGRAKLLDFGLVRRAEKSDLLAEAPQSARTEPGTILGTVAYMSPEQAQGEDVDHRADLYALGAMLFEMVTGRPPFLRNSIMESLVAAIRDDPPALISASGETVPEALRRAVEHCLEKRPDDRFQSARDLAFALEGFLGTTGGDTDVGAMPSRTSRPALVAAGLALALLGGALGWSVAGRRAHEPPPPPPARIRPLTFTGSDRAPAPSPDGRTVAFASNRDGRPRIWLKQLPGGTEGALTAGPDDRPRFSPDGGSILFVRAEDETNTLYRQAVVGGTARKVVENAYEGDWSPTGEWIAFLRPEGRGGRQVNAVGMARADGSGERLVTRVEGWNLSGIRWSPDGRRIAITRFPLLAAAPDLSAAIVLVEVESGETTVVSHASSRGSLLSAVAWTAADELVFAWGKILGPFSSEPSQLVRRRLGSDTETPLFWASHLFSGNATTLPTVSILGPETLLFDVTALRQVLVDVPAGAPPAGAGPLTRGTGRDRQPAYSPDGATVLFSSNRSGNLDIWSLTSATGELRQLTDDSAEDWDPYFTRDGRHLLWSSGRSGHLEVWRAQADGSSPARVSSDGADAENPTATPDGGWIVYVSGNPEKLGIWKVRADGSDASQLAEGTHAFPEVSPDGRYVLFTTLEPASSRNLLSVVELDSGEPVAFTVEIPYLVDSPHIRTLGRCRWLPDGQAVAFLAQDVSGRISVYAQDFTPGRDSGDSRRLLTPGQTTDVESFGIAPAGDRLTVSLREESSQLMLAEGVWGVAAPASSNR